MVNQDKIILLEVKQIIVIIMVDLVVVDQVQVHIMVVVEVVDILEEMVVIYMMNKVDIKVDKEVDHIILVLIKLIFLEVIINQVKLLLHY